MLEALSYGLRVLANDIPANVEIGLPRERYFSLGDIDALAQLRADGVQLFARRLNDEAGLEVWIREQHAWHKSVVDLLHTDFTQAVCLRFENLGSLSDKAFGHAISAQHNQELLMVDRRLEILQEIVGSQTAITR